MLQQQHGPPVPRPPVFREEETFCADGTNAQCVFVSSGLTLLNIHLEKGGDEADYLFMSR